VLDPQWLIDVISRIIRVHHAGLHSLPVDALAQRLYPDEWQQLLEEGKLARPLLELFWADGALTASAEERRALRHLLEKFDLLVEWKEEGGADDTYLVPAMLPVRDGPTALEQQEEVNGTSPCPEFFFVFRDDRHEWSAAEASKGFLPEGFFARLLKKAANWHQYTAKGGRKPVLYRNWARLSFGEHAFVLELQERTIRVQLLVQNPTLVVERLVQMVAEIKSECMAKLESLVAVRIVQDDGASGGAIFVSLATIKETIGTQGKQELWIGKGHAQRALPAAMFRLWCPPAVEAAYDVFISYRQAADAEFARMVFDCLTRFVFGKQGRRLRVFLDSERLLDGLSWKDGFIDGVSTTTVLVPIVSRGCLEPMAQLNLNGADWCDNVLLGKR
jgi:hypothetical protein